MAEGVEPCPSSVAKCKGRREFDSPLCPGSTPLLLMFDGQPIICTRGGEFSFTPAAPQRSDWPTAATPWLVLDLDGSGAIESGAELFGSGTTLPDGSFARNGFEALAILDENHDGRIDARDPKFAELQLWHDFDRDRKSTPNELSSAASVLVSVSLAIRVKPRCDARNNCERERTSMLWRDGHGVARKGEVVDVYLPER